MVHTLLLYIVEHACLWSGMPSTFHLLPVLLAFPLLSRPPACSRPWQAEEEAGCWYRNVDLPWSLYRGLQEGVWAGSTLWPSGNLWPYWGVQTHTYSHKQKGLCGGWERTGRADAVQGGFLEEEGFKLGLMARQDLEKEWRKEGLRLKISESHLGSNLGISI